MYVFSARPFENHLCERLPCLKIINNNNNNNNNRYLLSICGFATEKEGRRWNFLGPTHLPSVATLPDLASPHSTFGWKLFIPNLNSLSQRYCAGKASSENILPFPQDVFSYFKVTIKQKQSLKSFSLTCSFIKRHFRGYKSTLSIFFKELNVEVLFGAFKLVQYLQYETDTSEVSPLNGRKTLRTIRVYVLKL
jgi:hypothetical protein